MAASFKWVLQLHRDVPKAARFYSQGLDFTVNVCTLRWAELESGPLKLALMQASSDHVVEKGYSSLLSFTVTDINNTVTKLMALGAELDGPIKHEIHGKVAAMRCLDGHMDFTAALLAHSVSLKTSDPELLFFVFFSPVMLTFCSFIFKTLPPKVIE